MSPVVVPGSMMCRRNTRSSQDAMALAGAVSSQAGITSGLKQATPPSRAAHRPPDDPLSPLKPSGAQTVVGEVSTHSIPPPTHTPIGDRQGTSHYLPSPKGPASAPGLYTRLGSAAPLNPVGGFVNPVGRWSPVQRPLAPFSSWQL